MIKKLALLFLLSIASTFSIASQFPAPTQTPPPVPKLSEQLEQRLSAAAALTTSREDREQAFAKLLEGQRYLWRVDRLRSRSARQDNARLAREAFRRSVELDPTISEGYIALAELAINGQAQDIDEAISLARLATRVNMNSFGARRLLARLYTFQSRLTGPSIDPAFAEKAMVEWNHVTRLDPRNAEAWAFLGELYTRSSRDEQAVEALRRWHSATSPVDGRFYQMVMGGQGLTPENAAVKLGSMLLKTGRVREAIETLGGVVADDADNSAAIEVLRNAIENAEPSAAATAIESLRRAVAANPTNVPLVNLLADVQARSGKVDEAAASLRATAEKMRETDRAAAAMLYITLGDLYRRADKIEPAIGAYESAVGVRDIHRGQALSEDDRESVQHAFEKIIQTLKNAERFEEAKNAIDRADNILGKSSTFADRQAVSLLRETGDRQGALARVRSLRQRQPSEHGLLRLEATLLTELGKVEEGVALIRKDMESAKAATPPANPPSAASGESVAIAVPPADAFSNYLFISNLYSTANRGREAVEAAKQAYAMARGSERKQIARLTLATAQQMSGDFKGAETTLRDLLKETPGNPIALNNLGYFLLERDTSIQEAFDLIQQAVKVDPTNPSYLDSLGWAYFKLGKLVEAEKYLREALSNDSGSGTIHEHLGDVYQKQGKSAMARASWTRAASLFSEAADVARVKKKLGGK